MTALQITVQIVLFLLSVGMLGAFFRLRRGPSLPDRVVALDLIGVLIVTIIASLSIWLDLRVLVDILLAMALVSFLGTVALAKYIERGS
ncbi:MAG: hypothetical protein KF784_13970 [Fimbriimonadaceae bacterium]|nr:hypothetical protein [Fimbriimonadaceae bacterium]